MPSPQQLRSRCVQLDVPTAHLEPLRQAAARRHLSLREYLSRLLRKSIDADPAVIRPALPPAPRRSVGAQITIEQYRWVRWRAAVLDTTMHRLCYGLIKPQLDRLPET